MAATHPGAGQENALFCGLALSFDGRLRAPRDEIVFTLFFLKQLHVKRSMGKRKRRSFVYDNGEAFLSVWSVSDQVGDGSGDGG